MMAGQREQQMTRRQTMTNEWCGHVRSCWWRRGCTRHTRVVSVAEPRATTADAVGQAARVKARLLARLDALQAPAVPQPTGVVDPPPVAAGSGRAVKPLVLASTVKAIGVLLVGLALFALYGS